MMKTHPQHWGADLVSVETDERGQRWAHIEAATTRDHYADEFVGLYVPLTEYAELEDKNGYELNAIYNDDHHYYGGAFEHPEEYDFGGFPLLDAIAPDTPDGLYWLYV